MYPGLRRTNRHCTREEGRERDTRTLSGTPQVPGATVMPQHARVINTATEDRCRHWPAALKWQGFFLHTLLIFGSDTESAPAMPMSVGNQPPASGNDTPKLEEYQGASKIQTKARAKPDCWAESKKPHAASLLPVDTAHHGWHDGLGKDIHILPNTHQGRKLLTPAPAGTLGYCSNYRKSQRQWHWAVVHHLLNTIHRIHDAGLPGNTTNQTYLGHPPSPTKGKKIQDILEEPEKT